MLSSEKTLAVVLGVSRCPRAPKLQPLPQCANSASDFQDYLLNILKINEILNLFDSTKAASEQIEEIEDWLQTRLSNSNKFTDLVIYYTGHGGITRNDQAYFLAVHKTREGAEGATSIRYIDLASSIRRHAGVLRKYLILDCCFAASAVVGTQSDINDLIIGRVEDELPPSGTALLCSSAAKMVSIAPAGEQYTMFSGAFLQCLRDGIPNAPTILTLEAVGSEVRKIIKTKYPNDAVRPELHVPDQTKGDPATVPLFPNFSPLAVEQILDATSSPPRVIVDQWAAPRKLMRRGDVQTALGIFSGLLSAYSTYLIDGPVSQIAPNHTWPPVLPAVFLAAVLNLVIWANSRNSIIKFIYTLPATYFSWQIAWLTAQNPLKDLVGLVGLVSSMGLAGYVGYLLLSTALIPVIFEWRLSLKRHILLSAIQAVPLGVLSAAVTLQAVLSATMPTDLAPLISLMVPWQAWCLYLFSSWLHEDRWQIHLQKRSYWLGLATTACFISFFDIRLVREQVNLFAAPPLEMSSGRPTASTKNRDVIVDFSVVYNTPIETECESQLRIEPTDAVDKQKSRYTNLRVRLKKGLNISKITFSNAIFEQSDLFFRIECSHDTFFEKPQDYVTPWFNLGAFSP